MGKPTWQCNDPNIDPDPLNPTTTISIVLRMRSFVALRVFDKLGKKVVVLISEKCQRVCILGNEMRQSCLRHLFLLIACRPISSNEETGLAQIAMHEIEAMRNSSPYNQGT